MKKTTLLVLTITLFFIACKNDKKQQTENNETKLETEKALFVNNEVNTFWKYYDETDSTKRNNLLASYALDSVNNPAVNTMFKMTLNDTTSFYNRINQYSSYYKSIQNQSLEMANKQYPKMDAYYKEFKKMYSKAHRPKIIFTVGALTVGGTVTDEGLVIGTELYGKESGDTTGMGRMAKFLLTPENFIPLTFHEHMHYEQLKNFGGKENFHKNVQSNPTLLGVSLNEGAADFVSNLITGWNNDKPNYIYGNKNEAALWEKFKSEMDSAETIQNWMYDYRVEKETPPDLGYFMGAKICESYYNNATDKEKAIEDILSIDDPKGFLEKSKYREKFAEK